MKKIIFFTILIALNNMLFANEIAVKEEIKVYKVPLQYTNNINDIENHGVLKNKKIKILNEKGTVISTDMATLIFTKDNLSDEDKIKQIIKILNKFVKQSNIQNKEATLKLIKLLKELHQ
jgi:spermidine/putrescine-binding protein